MAEMRSIISEYGLKWLINRSLYTAKLKSLNKFRFTENFYERNINDIEKLGLIDIDVELLLDFYNNIDEEYKSEIIQSADNAVRGKIKAFSNLDLDYGFPINWHKHPISKVEVSKELKWFEIPDFHAERGDIKLIWEISRFTHFFLFIKAYLITNNEDYYEAFSIQLDSWVKNNVYTLGSNYKCGQEATLRMINVLYGYAFFKKVNLLTREDEENVKTIVNDCYKKVRSNFFYAHKCIRNNHTLSEITGLIVGSWCTNDADALKKAYKLMDEEIEQQFTPDGGYRQFSFNYQRFALQLMEFNLMISNKTNISLNNESKERIKRSISLITQVMQENGRVPNYGSNDGALIFPLTQCGYLDYRPIVNTLNYQLNKSKLFQEKLINEEIIWFTGDDPTKIEVVFPEKKSLSFPQAGIHTIRKQDFFVMLVNNQFDSRPAQMDQNHIDFWYKDFNIFCDTGTYSYASEIGQSLASSKGHNTAQIDGIEMMNKKGPFFIYNWTENKELLHSSNSITSSYYSKNGYEHCRDVTLSGKSLKIVDRLDRGLQFSIYFHTPYQVRLINNELQLTVTNNISITLKTDGYIRLEKSYESLYYYQKREITRIVIQKNKSLKKINTTLEMNG